MAAHSLRKIDTFPRSGISCQRRNAARRGSRGRPSRAAGATTTAVYVGTATICRRRGRRLLRLPFFTPALEGWRSIRWESLMEERSTRESDRMQEIISLCKPRGVIFPSNEIYGGLQCLAEYWPLV